MRLLSVALSLCLVGGWALATPPPDGLVSPKGLEGIVRLDRLPVPENPILARGREAWDGTCVNCHSGNRATGAPKITSSDDWAPRIAQGMDVLFAHAIDGFMGPKFTQMPPRGGSDLSDEDIFAAVAFMVWASGGAKEALAYAQSKE